MANYRTYRVSYGDTLAKIAQKFNVSRLDIIDLNQLEYPFIVSDLTPPDNNIHIKNLGETLFIPVSEDEAEGIEDLYGSDLMVGYDSLVYAELQDNGNYDLGVVNGMNNLKQALWIRLMTPEGSLVLHPEYGSRIMLIIKEGYTETQNTKMEIEVARCLKCDYRVEDVTDVLVTKVGDKLKIYCKVWPKNTDQIIIFDGDMEVDVNV